MNISGNQIKVALGTLQIARDNWDLDIFANSVYGDDYHLEDRGRKKYLKEKWNKFCADPLKFYFTLDLAQQAHINKFLKHLVARVAI